MGKGKRKRKRALGNRELRPPPICPRCGERHTRIVVEHGNPRDHGTATRVTRVVPAAFETNREKH
jgi:hypothetical protein